MRKAMPYLGAALSALAISWTVSASAQDGQFKDLQQDHWAYQAVNELQQKGILEGYPDGFFRGKRTLTRYEFAIAIKRLLDKLPAMLPPGPAGPAGPPGPAGTTGEAGTGTAGNFATKEDLDTIRGLVTRFEGDLRALGTDVTAVKARLDAAEKDIADIKSQLSKMPKISGSFGVYARTDLSRNQFVDYGGAIRNPGAILGNANVAHDFHIGITAPINGDGKFISDLVASNYLGGYRGNTLSTVAIAQSQTGSGSNANDETLFVRRAELQIPVKVGKNGLLKLGRYLFQITPGIYQRPDLDPYFDTDYDDGNFSQDGVLLRLGIGSFNTEFFAASFASVTGVNSSGINNPINSPLVGSLTGTPRYFGKPFNINATGQNTTANQVAGVTVKVPLFKIGEVGFTGATFSTDSAAAGTSNMTLFGAYIKPKPFGRINILAEAAKTINGSRLGNIGEAAGEPSGNEDNTYFNLKLGYASGPIEINGGYIYVDPRYSAPGNWLKIGNWYNPTNVRGPYADVSYKVSKGLNLNLAGNWLEGARNRNSGAGIGGFGGSGLSIGDDIYRVKAGIAYAFSPRVSLGVDYEGVLYDLSAATSGTGGGNRTKPIEQYITISTGLHIANNTMLKIGYQLLNFQNVGGGFSNGNQGVTGVAGVGATGNSYNANSLTAQLQVKF
ncbi:MAG: S-layer homology domain-containing protein [Chthonomonadaceae bacterium]|nr:S-layer homology domain-containing protein [Chthonomonadaceae bacterium]